VLALRVHGRRIRLMGASESTQVHFPDPSFLKLHFESVNNTLSKMHFILRERNSLALAAALLKTFWVKRIETVQHSERVASYAVLTGKRLGLPVRLLENLHLAALLHDIGKVGVPDTVLRKPGPLNADEWRLVKMHPGIGFELLRYLPDFREVAELVYSHHERHDGTGYPRGLADTEISIGGKILSVVDTYDAITSDRPYQAGRSCAMARAEISRMCGSQFDPIIVKCFLSIPEPDLEAIRLQKADVYLDVAASEPLRVPPKHFPAFALPA
jgi:HD-GYP domain-containing protein (c-di-GMP phosphodiesterase class II)